MGQAGQLVGAAVGRVAAAPAPGAFSDVDTGGPATGRNGGPEQATGSGTATGAGPVAPDGVGAAAPDGTSGSGAAPASFGAVFTAFVLIGAAGFGSWTIWSSGANAETMQPPDTVAVFGVLIVFAAAVERILEPFSRWLPGRRVEAAALRAETELANLSREATPAERAAVAALREQADRGRGNRTIVAWGIAVAVATLASTAGGFYLLHAIAGPEWEGLPVWVDGIVTGIMVGSGTKPMHDLITRIQPGGGARP
ncbi:hypothetical protein [Plantactinospora endophytica]|uniref:Uncharacterized protein n=1 Tax=Plantactinospora endophytica TaxID=673535 RepID=A0ABQ4DU58_9ACTN|nr:hypothetical protein [Plantactinospora endophytica]GIG85972.1 hypothetical protein Pen02_09080 [Plantactinospora endophytica]